MAPILPHQYPEQRVKNLESKLDGLRHEQKMKPRIVKSMQTKRDKLRKISCDPKASLKESNDAELQLNLGQQKFEYEQHRLKDLRNEINDTEVELIKAQEALKVHQQKTRKVAEKKVATSCNQKKRKADDTISTNIGPRKLVKVVQAKDARVLKDKSTNTNVKKRKATDAQAPARKKWRGLPQEEDSGDERRDGPVKCATSAQSKGGQGHSAPMAHISSSKASSSTPAGKKRSAASSVGDASAPRAKRLKTVSESIGKDSEGAGEQKASGNEARADEKESGAGEVGETNKPGPRTATATRNSASISSDSRPSSERPPELPPKGIYRDTPTCYSSVVIQLIKTALRGHDPDRLLAKHGESESDVSGQLRKLLQDLDKHDGKKAIPASDFLSALAQEGWHDPASRQHDVSEYFTALMDVLSKNSETTDPNALGGLFYFKTESIRRCARLTCGYKSEPREALNNHHVLPIHEAAEFSMLFKSSKSSPTDMNCPRCGKSKLTEVTKFTEKPANLVMYINRIVHHNGNPTKNCALVEHDKHELNVDGTDYSMSAVIMHRGRAANYGHYFIYCKQDRDWYKIDDSDVEKVAAKDVADCSKEGQSTMLLFKRDE